MNHPTPQSWQRAFWQVIEQPEYGEPLRAAALRGNLGAWTRALTGVTVAACEALGWHAAAKDHPSTLLPVPYSEYLTLDVLAFAPAATRWAFPVAAFELENSSDSDRIAYSLWKVLCVRVGLRAVFCYRRSADEAAPLVRILRESVVQALPLAERARLEGETLLIVGSRAEAETFPYGFFKWWRLEVETGAFRPV